MAGPITVADNTLITKDPSAVSVLVFDWGAEHLATGVGISTSTFTITALKPTSDTALTKDQPSIVSGNRKTQIRIAAGTLGALYQLDNTIVTNESPAQTKERRIRILVQTR
jgi:hypothetical protein